VRRSNTVTTPYVLVQRQQGGAEGPEVRRLGNKKAILECAPERERLVRTFRGSREVWWYLWMKHRDSRVGGGIWTGLRETPDQSLFVTPRVQSLSSVTRGPWVTGELVPVNDRQQTRCWYCHRRTSSFTSTEQANPRHNICAVRR